MIKRRRSFRGVLGVVLLSLFALSACSGGDGPKGATGSEKNSIVVGGAQGFPQLNPAIRTFAFEDTLFTLLWSSLTKYQEDGTIGPDLAKSWTSNDDATEWTFTLVPDATFSDGSPLDAQAVVDTLKYYRDPATVTQEANKLDAIESVKATDDTTVVITLSRPIAVLPESLSGVKIIKVSALDSINDDPVTSGPYVVSSFTPDNTLVVKRNDDFWGPKASLDEITFVKTADPTAAVTSLRSGDIDVLWNVPFSDVGSLEDAPGIHLVRPSVVSDAVDWEVDMTSPPFDNVVARKALAYAVDREAILKSAYFGQGEVSKTNTILSSGNPAFASDLEEYPYDIDKAKELFAQAGVTRLTWWGVSGAYPEWEATAQILQADLKKAGVDLKIENHEIATWADKFYPSGKKFPGMVVPNGLSASAEPTFSMNFLLSGRCECNFNSSEYDDAFAAAVGTVDGDARNQAWAEPQVIESEQVPLIIPLFKSPSAGVVDGVSGIWLEGGNQIHLENATTGS